MSIAVIGIALGDITCDVGEGSVGVRERHVETAVRTGPLRERLEACTFSCQKGLEPSSGARCLSCPSFVNAVPSRDGGVVTIRCAFAPRDPVKRLMSMAGALITIAPDKAVGDARTAARVGRIDRLLVADGEVLAGLVTTSDLAGVAPERPVREVMTRILCVVHPDTWLVTCARLMAGQDIDCLPVVENGLLRGIVTRGDLRRAGVA